MTNHQPLVKVLVVTIRSLKARCTFTKSNGYWTVTATEPGCDWMRGHTMYEVIPDLLKYDATWEWEPEDKPVVSSKLPGDGEESV